jgi:hypothetical protein
MLDLDILHILGATGDVGIILLVLIMWRFDRRLLLIETVLNSHISSHSEEESKLDVVIGSLVKAGVLKAEDLLHTASLSDAIGHTKRRR